MMLGQIAEERLVRVLDERCGPFSGCHHVLPKPPPIRAGVRMVVNALRYEVRMTVRSATRLRDRSMLFFALSRAPSRSSHATQENEK
jgi:hypothetical protein